MQERGSVLLPPRSLISRPKVICGAVCKPHEMTLCPLLCGRAERKKRYHSRGVCATPATAGASDVSVFRHAGVLGNVLSPRVSQRWVELTHLRSDGAYNVQPDINTLLKITVCTML